MSKLKADSLKRGLSMGGAPAGARDRFADAAKAASDDILSPGTHNRTVESPTQAASAAAPKVDGGAPRYVPGMPVHAGGRYFVELQYVADNPNNPREFYTQEALQELADSLRREGQLMAAQAYAPLPGSDVFTLFEGHSRKLALKANGAEGIVLEVVPPAASAMEGYRQAREINKQRNDLTVFDDAARFRELVDSGVVTSQEELAIAVRESAEYVSKVLGIGRMPTALLREMATSTEYRFGMTMAHNVRMFYELKEDEQKALQLVRKIKSSRLSVRQVEQLLAAERQVVAGTGAEAQASVAKAGHRMRPLSRAVFNGAGEGELKYFPDGRLELNIAVKDEAVRGPLFNQVVEALKAVGVDVVSGVSAA